MSSTFEVTQRRIDRIWPHPSADRLELAAVTGLAFQFCIQKGTYTVGQKVVYFPVDSQLPQWLIDRLDLWGKDENGVVIKDDTGRVVKTMLVGDAQNRIHTVQLRGEISQGMVCPSVELSIVDPNADELVNLASLLGVTKYDAPESILKGAKLLSFPDGVTPFDVESADSNPDVLNQLMDELVWITEKLEGTNHGVVRLPEGRNAVTARNNEVQELTEPDEFGNPPETYPGWDAVRRQGLENILANVPRPDFPIMPVAIRGELIGPGIPRNFYPVKHPEIRVFAIKVGPNYLNAADVRKLIPEGMQVPTLAYNVTLRSWLAGRTMQEASNGKSLLAPDRLREGIVVVPMVEKKVQWKDLSIKRLMLKQRSPKYLAKEKD